VLEISVVLVVWHSSVFHHRFHVRARRGRAFTVRASQRITAESGSFASKWFTAVERLWPAGVLGSA
jgi:hypothetical protein